MFQGGRNCTRTASHASTAAWRVVVVDDEEDMRVLLRDTLANEPDLLCVGDFARPGHALANIPALQPHLALIDIRLPEMTGLDLASRLQVRCPGIRTLIVTGLNRVDNFSGAWAAGASAFITKPFVSAHILAAIRAVIQGAVVISAAAAHHLQSQPLSIAHPAAASKLTAREAILLQSLAGGRYYKEIADLHQVRVIRVQKWVHRLYLKLHVHTRSEAISWWYESGSQSTESRTPNPAPSARRTF